MILVANSNFEGWSYSKHLSHQK